MTEFKETKKQIEANRVIGADATHCLLFGGSRCVSGDTIIDGHRMTIRELAEIGDQITVKTTRGTQLASAPYRKGACRMVRVELKSGRSIEVTPDHRFWNGDQWVFARDLSSNDSVAVLSSQRTLPESSLGPFLSGLRAGVRSLREKSSDLMGHCSIYSHRYGQPPHSVKASFQACRGLQSYAQEHTQKNRCHSYRAERLLGLNIHKVRFSKLAAVDSRTCQESFLLSSMDDVPLSWRLVLFLSLYCERTYESFQGLHKKCQQVLTPFFFLRSIFRVVDNCFFRFCRFFGLSYDIPSGDGYKLDNVLRVTRTSEKSYYCLQVPTTEQYFANGILNHNSGKTFKLIRVVCIRAMAAEGSRHAVLRFRFNHVKSSIVLDTFPKVMQLCFPQVKYHIDKTDWYAEFPNKSQIWFGGLDDKERTEKILGQEHATIYKNECSQIPYNSHVLTITRLAQKCTHNVGGKDIPLRLKMLYDCNPPSQSHWTYQLFVKKIDPDTKQPLPNPDDYVSMVINPADNSENLPKEYLDALDSLPARHKLRFRDGIFAPVADDALWSLEDIEKWRKIDGFPDMQRVVVAVDPSGASDDENQVNDPIGIVVAGLGVDGNGYLLEDNTVLAGPVTWGNVVTTAFDRHMADVVVGENNFGGAMVEHVIQTARKRTPYRKVTASRGKVVRAEPVAALAEQGRIRHAGYFPELEDELCDFTRRGYLGDRSPNRADAYIWAFTELFGAIVAGPTKEHIYKTPQLVSAYAL